MKERFEIIREICRGKRCLDIGIVGDLQHHVRQPDKWVFHQIGQVSSELVGLDLEAAALGALRGRGYRNLVCANAEEFALRKRFDVIVAGEIIEHLSNPGSFLNRCREHLVPGGLIVMTTPNTFSVNNLVKGLLFGRVALFHEHVNAYTVGLLEELLRRHGLEIARVEYFTERNPGLKNHLFRLLSRLRYPWAEGLLVVGRATTPAASAGSHSHPVPSDRHH
jgi:SAM-dependent methyltransferase